jgi:hypothetical protein
VTQWRRKTIAKVTGVGFLTPILGGLGGGLLAALDLAYLFAAAGRGCYGIGHILGRDITVSALQGLGMPRSCAK